MVVLTTSVEMPIDEADARANRQLRRPCFFLSSRKPLKREKKREITMSTRCQIEFYDANPTDGAEPAARIYKHSDGYASLRSLRLKRVRRRLRTRSSVTAALPWIRRLLRKEWP